MVKNLVVIIIAFFTMSIFAQQSTSSPYSYFGIGELSFRGTVENQSMGGLSVLADSIHLNLQNPAGLGKLKLTTFTVGGRQNFNRLADDSQSTSVASTSLDYVAVALPMKKLGVSFGLYPYSSVGYKTGFTDPLTADVNEQRFEGSGGLNRVFFNAGYSITDDFSVGVDLNYNFGTIEQESYTIIDADISPYDTNEFNTSKLSGLVVGFGLHYKKEIKENLELVTGLTYSPEIALNSKNTRDLSLVTWTDQGVPLTVDSESIDVADTEFKLPSRFALSVGISQPKKWLIGAEFETLGTKSASNRFFDFQLSGSEYENSSKIKLGGYYIPRYNSLTSYWKRVVYRGGLRYQKTGLVINGNNINEFGMSFGAGLPVGRVFSNLNLMLEYGSRGTRSDNLVKENFFNVGISLSFNDKWFQRRKID